jgi:hypothetical protein
VEREEGGQLGGVIERDQGGWPCSGTVEMLVVGPPTAVENTGAVRRSASTQAVVIFFLENGDNRLRLGTCGREATTIGLVLWPANGSIRRVGRPHRSISEEQMAPTSYKLQFETITPLQA